MSRRKASTNLRKRDGRKNCLARGGRKQGERVASEAAIVAASSEELCAWLDVSSPRYASKAAARLLRMPEHTQITAEQVLSDTDRFHVTAIAKAAGVCEDIGLVNSVVRDLVVNDTGRKLAWAVEYLVQQVIADSGDMLPGELAVGIADELAPMSTVGVKGGEAGGGDVLFEHDVPSVPSVDTSIFDAIVETEAQPDEANDCTGLLIDIESATTQKAVNAIKKGTEDAEVLAACADKLKALRSAASKRGAAARKAG